MHVKDEFGCTLPVSFNIACWQMRHCLAGRFLPVAEKTTYTAFPPGLAEACITSASFYVIQLLGLLGRTGARLLPCSLCSVPDCSCDGPLELDGDLLVAKKYLTPPLLLCQLFANMAGCPDYCYCRLLLHGCSACYSRTSYYVGDGSPTFPKTIKGYILSLACSLFD